MPRALERLLIVVASLAIAIGVIALLSGGLVAGHDDPGVSGGGAGPGIAYPDQGDAHLAAGARRPPYDSDPPTSGPHAIAPVTRDRAVLSDDQLLTALEAGDVVLLYGSPRPPADLTTVAAGVAAPFTRGLAAGGGAVILARRPGTAGVIAVAWERMLRLGTPDEQALRAFAEYWLGRGARAAR